MVPASIVKIRKEIRKKIVELLKGKTDAQNRVFPNATVPAWEEELPVILVYPRSEPVTEYAIAPRELERRLDVAIEIIAKGPETDEAGNPPANKSLEDILDDIAEQVEIELSRDETFGGTADGSILTSTEFEFEGNGGLPIGSARLTYTVTYYRMSPDHVDKQAKLQQAGTDSLPDLEQTGIEYDIDQEPDTIEAEDLVDVPTS